MLISRRKLSSSTSGFKPQAGAGGDGGFPSSGDSHGSAAVSGLAAGASGARSEPRHICPGTPAAAACRQRDMGSTDLDAFAPRRDTQAALGESGGGALAAVVVVVAGWSGWEWYLHRPHPVVPNLITFQVDGPTITDYELGDGTPGITIHPVDVKFSASTAPIELVGKPVVRGITLDPALKGGWIWVDDRTLRFTPAQDWPIGAHVAIQFDPAQAFASHV